MALIIDDLLLIFTAARQWAEDEESRNRFIAPEEVAKWLPRHVAETIRLVSIPGRANLPTEGEVATAATVAIYKPAPRSPATTALPANLPELIAHLTRQIAFVAPGDQRAVERILVHGVLLPPDGSGWDRRWIAAWDTLFHLVRRHLAGSLDWIGKNVLHYKGASLKGWVHGEADATAAMIRTALVHGCDCHVRWCDFHIEDEAKAIQHCEGRHVLTAWDRTQPLDFFLTKAAIQGVLNDDRAYITDFRRGMLAKSAADSGLVSGPILRCPEESCRGEIQPDDRCDAPAHHVGCVRDPTWWLWIKGERGLSACRRCFGCCPDHGCLRFRGTSDHCFVCEQSNWSGMPTKVWVPIHWEVLPNPAVLAAPPGADGQWDQPDPLEIIGRLNLAPEQRAVALGILDQRKLAEVADELGLNLRSRRFRSLVSDVRETLTSILGNE